MLTVKRINTRSGMTFVEIMVSLGLFILLLGVSLSIWSFVYKTWAVENIRTKLRVNLEMAVENIKSELRLSSAEFISLYKPPSESDYKAISFSLPTIGNDGFAVLQADGTIFWDRSVIYHVYENPPGSGTLELRRTEFTDNHDILINTSQREAQLSSVYTNGSGTGALNGSNSATKIIFRNLVDLTIEPQLVEFDGYSPTTTRSGNVELGSIKLTSGEHIFKFFITGKNASSSGFSMGLDSVTITKSGCTREVEVYPVEDSSGDSSSIIYALGWGGNNYFQYSSDAVDDYVSFRIYYDQFLESNFDETIRSNTILTSGTNSYPNNPFVQLAAPSDNSVTCWQASTQTGSGPSDYPPAVTGDVLPASDDFVIRNVIRGTGSGDSVNVAPDGKKFRIKFVAHSSDSLTINSAYFAERSVSNPEDTQGAVYQVFFGGNPNALIPGGGELWSDWITYTIQENKDYMITFYTSVVSNNKKFKYWDPGTSTVNSYFSDVSDNSASDPNWDTATCVESPLLFSVEDIEQWANKGTVISKIYDTKINGGTAPSYDTLSWVSSVGADISVELRAGDQSDLGDAASWTSVSNGGSIPASLDGRRYIQFRATLTSPSPYTDIPWIDDVSINWPGETATCDISCYFTQKPSYGILSLKIDNMDLVKGLKFSVMVYDDFRGIQYDQSLTAEVEPRNTGK